MSTLYIICGLPFSGKSTLANKIADEINAEYLSFDSFWVEHEKEVSLTTGADNIWKEMRKQLFLNISNLLSNGKSVVYDDMNPRREHREELKKLAREAGEESRLVYLSIPEDVLELRKLENLTTKVRHEVSVENMKKAYEDWQEPSSDELPFIVRTDYDIKEVVSHLVLQS